MNKLSNNKRPQGYIPEDQNPLKNSYIIENSLVTLSVILLSSG